MRVLLARLLIMIALMEGTLSIPVRLADATLFGISGGGYLFASIPTLLLAIYLIIEDLRDNMKRHYQ